MEYSRNCSKCNKILTYTNGNTLQQANRFNSPCLSCSKKGANWSALINDFTCIDCNKKLVFKQARKKDSIHSCRSCAMTGNRNGFYGKKHTIETKEKISIEGRGKNTGADNHRYGKPPAQGSGNGWSGWYKGWFFRSLRELSYMINVIEKEGLEWETGEQKKLRISYVQYNGKNSNYFADFLLEGTRLIEIKPKALHSSVVVTLKKAAAEQFCVSRGWTYELIDPEVLNEEEIFSLHEKKKIEFLPRYEKKIQGEIF